MPGGNHGDVSELLTAKFDKQRVIDIAAVSGPGHAYMSSLCRVLRNYKSQMRAVSCVKEVHPDYSYLVEALNTTTEESDAVTTTTTIMGDYDMDTVSGSDYYNHESEGPLQAYYIWWTLLHSVIHYDVSSTTTTILTWLEATTAHVEWRPPRYRPTTTKMLR